MDWSVMQSEHREWLKANYPDQPPEVPAAGLVEEAGELMHAVLKLEQVRRWGEEGEYTRNKLLTKLVDAVGDVAIYACSCCNAMSWDFEELVAVAIRDSRVSTRVPYTSLTAAVYIVRASVDVAVGKCNRSELALVLSRLIEFCEMNALTLGECVHETWARVRTRVRRSKPIVVCLCGSTRFMREFRDAELHETLAGRIVLTIGCDAKSDDMLKFGVDTKQRLDELHLRKIDMADSVLILNVGGYIGESTAREIAYALSLGKLIRYLEPV